jgi:23S rRNA pseudouridine955/2504/2580 synthase/23S rRNA pseudouridine1911/1915/1917 synthase
MSLQINIADHVLLEDPYILLINKPCSLMVEPDRNGHPNLLHQVQRYLKSRLPKGELVYAQHIHRLDRPVSGIVLFAKQKVVLKNLSEQFAERKVKKYYQALTEGSPRLTDGILENWHRKEKKRAIICDEGTGGAEKIKLTYSIQHVSPTIARWSIELHTGKFHQIRAQLSAAGCPIVGDTFYGSTLPYKPDSIALHACRLTFYHPITNEVVTVEKEAVF